MTTESPSPSSLDNSDNPGDMRLYDAYKPGLTAGAYRLALQQTVQFKQRDTEFTHYYHRNQRFVVQAPRFFIDPGEIHACYPPPDVEGRFDTILPHLVLRKRSLPWERALTASDSEPPLPWLALLVLSGEELAAVGGKGPSKTVRPEELVRPDDRHLRESGQDILLPDLTEELSDEPGEGGPDDEKPRVKVLDLPMTLFLGLCPPLEDLAFLAHLRRVSMAEKAPLQMHAPGEFSVLVANRLPQEGLNTVYLVSLEGWASLLQTRAPPPAFTARAGASPEPKVRLVTLASWRFTHDQKDAFTFATVMRSLKLDSFGLGAEPFPDGAAVNDVLRRGAVPVKYRHSRDAVPFAWYRGPLVAREPPRLESLEEHYGRPRTEALLDKATGVPDLSYATAWQLGRLLALASPSFSHGLQDFFDQGDCTSALRAAQRLDNYLTTHRSAVNSSRESGDRDAVSARSKPDLVAELVDWLARLVLLQPVPFGYLVADQRLLPAESLRFFHIDNNWVEALATGALSLAVRHGRARDRPSTMLGEAMSISEALSRMVHQYWKRRQGMGGASASDQPRSHFMNQVKSGFLLRSVAVSGWPGLELQVETDASVPALESQDATIPKLLRLEQLTPDLLLCIVHGPLSRVTLTEPPEGLRFGLDQSGTSPPPYRGGMEKGVVDVQALAGGPITPKSGSAALALKMILSPHRQVFHWVAQS